MSAFYLVGFIQSLFFSILIATKKRIQLSDFVLILYILMLGGNLIVTYTMATGYYSTHTDLAIVDIFYWVLLGPLLYLYIDLITSSRKKLIWKDLYHLTPMVIVFIGFSEFYFQSDVKDFFSYRSNNALYKISQYVWYYNSPIYYILVIIKLRRFRKDLTLYYSNTKNVDLKWLFYLAHGFAFFLLFLIGSGLLRSIFNIKLPFTSFSYTWLVLVAYIFGIGFFGYKQKGIFNELTELQTSDEKETSINNPKTITIDYIK